MAADYPAAQPVFTGSTETAPATTSPAPFAAWAQKVEDEIVAITGELGLDPAGLDATVRARLDDTGSTGFPPSYHGLLAWTFDWAVLSNVFLFPNVTGTMRTIRLWTPRPITVTNIVICITTGGATLTAGNNRCALFDAAGNYITNSITADQSTAWTSGGVKAMPCTASVAVAAGAFDIGMWVNGTTAPTLRRGGTDANIMGHGVGANVNIRYAGTNQTGLTATAPATVGTKTAAGDGFWAGVS